MNFEKEIIAKHMKLIKEFSFIKKRLAEVLKLLPEPSGQNESKKLDSMSPD